MNIMRLIAIKMKIRADADLISLDLQSGVQNQDEVAKKS